MIIKNYFNQNIEAIRIERDALDNKIKIQESNDSRNSYVKFTNELIEKSILLLQLEFEKIQPILFETQSAQGARTDIGSEVLSKQCVERLLNLKHKQAWEIQKLTKESVNLAIEYAKENNVLATRSLALKLSKKNKENEVCKNTEIKDIYNNINDSDDVIENDVKTKLYSVVYIDLTQNFNKNTILHLPIDKDAICFVWTKPNNLKEALSYIEELGFVYQNSVVWDKGFKNTNTYIINHHELLLIGFKNNYKIQTNNKFHLDSIHLEYQKNKNFKPDYYYSNIEKMCPNTQYLEVFSSRKYSSKWTVFGDQND
ncbi:hypothetical protein HDR59_05195 [bacterium]|nr:hypothetical protein [bacterium]